MKYLFIPVVCLLALGLYLQLAKPSAPAAEGPAAATTSANVATSAAVATATPVKVAAPVKTVTSTKTAAVGPFVPPPFASVRADDHVRAPGAASAEVVVIVYEDLDCPFCARLHASAAKLAEEYRGRVAWISRPAPLDIHPSAFNKAVMAECVAELAGPTAFWGFVDAAFASQADPNLSLYQLALGRGASREALSACVASSVTARAKVNQGLGDFAASGGMGTPWTTFENRLGKKDTMSGAMPIEDFRAKIDGLLSR